MKKLVFILLMSYSTSKAESNRMQVKLGVGPYVGLAPSLDKTSEAGGITNGQGRIVTGLELEHTFDSRIVLSVEGFSNETAVIGIGVEL